MQSYDVVAAATLVEAIHVLRHQQEVVELPFHRGQRQVGRVGRGGGGTGGTTMRRVQPAVVASTNRRISIPLLRPIGRSFIVFRFTAFTVGEGILKRRPSPAMDFESWAAFS